MSGSFPSNPQWFSATVRLISLIEMTEHSYMDVVLVFKANSWQVAFDRALVLGRLRQEEYRNGDDKTVAWRLSEILTLDAIANTDADLDGAEVLSVLTTASMQTPVADFRPELSKPRQTM